MSPIPSRSCLVSVINKYDITDRVVDLRVQTAWSNWGKLTGVLYELKIPLRLKPKVGPYEDIFLKPALMHRPPTLPSDERGQQDKNNSRDPRSVGYGGTHSDTGLTHLD